MTIYASRTPSATTECAKCETEFQEGNGYSETEHAEYHQAHPANPILVAYREHQDIHHIMNMMAIHPVAFPYATQDEIDHARRVLTRLANFTKEQKA